MNIIRHAVVIVVCFAGLAPEAQAVTTRALLALDLALDDPSKPDGLRMLGSIRSYMDKLKHAHRRCRIDSYEHGGLIVCVEAGAPSVLIELSAEPTRVPEYARVTSIRPKGANGGELPLADFSRFLALPRGIRVCAASALMPSQETNASAPPAQ